MGALAALALSCCLRRLRRWRWRLWRQAAVCGVWGVGVDGVGAKLLFVALALAWASSALLNLGAGRDGDAGQYSCNHQMWMQALTTTGQMEACFMLLFFTHSRCWTRWRCRPIFLQPQDVDAGSHHSRPDGGGFHVALLYPISVLDAMETPRRP